MAISYTLLDAEGYIDALKRPTTIGCPWRFEDPDLWSPVDRSQRLSYALSVNRAPQLDIQFEAGKTYVVPNIGWLNTRSTSPDYDEVMHFPAYVLTGTFSRQEVVTWYRTV